MSLQSKDFYKRFGKPTPTFERMNMVLWDIPQYISDCIPTLPRRIYCNKQMVLPLEIAFLNVIDKGLEREIKTYDGCFNNRPIRGYEKKFNDRVANGRWDLAAKYMSVHSWGCAIDINAFENGLGKTPKMRKELVSCFVDAGFEWGGNWTRKDGMHFQLLYLN